MITITSIHLFKVRECSYNSWGETVQELFFKIANIASGDNEKKKALLREIELAEKGDIENGKSYVKKIDAGYSVSFGKLMATVTKDHIQAYYAAPNSMKGWKDKKNSAFVNDKAPLFYKLADSKMADLVIVNKAVYGRLDWVYVFLKRPDVFYGFESIQEAYKKLKVDELIKMPNRETYVETKSSFFTKRKFISKLRREFETPPI